MEGHQQLTRLGRRHEAQQPTLICALQMRPPLLLETNLEIINFLFFSSSTQQVFDPYILGLPFSLSEVILSYLLFCFSYSRFNSICLFLFVYENVSVIYGVHGSSMPGFCWYIQSQLPLPF